ncbi:MAG: hypothetical protein ACETWB_06755 [Anaerolineae bacterium]
MSEQRGITCFRCGALNWKDSRFCTWCGTNLPPQTPPEGIPPAADSASQAGEPANLVTDAQATALYETEVTDDSADLTDGERGKDG